MMPKEGIVAYIAVFDAEDLERYVPSSRRLVVDQKHDARAMQTDTQSKYCVFMHMPSSVNHPFQQDLVRCKDEENLCFSEKMMFFPCVCYYLILISWMFLSWIE
jgi:hypothetical protein